MEVSLVTVCKSKSRSPSYAHTRLSFSMKTSQPGLADHRTGLMVVVAVPLNAAPLAWLIWETCSRSPSAEISIRQRPLGEVCTPCAVMRMG